MSKIVISHNKITDEVADNITDFLSRSISVKVLDLSYNRLQDAGAINICSANTTTLISVDFRCNNCITTTATEVIKFYISYHNLQLQVLL